MAMGVAAVLLLGMAGALRMTVGAADTGEDRHARDARTRAGLDQLRAELSTAVSVTRLEAQKIVFTVPDRDGDGTVETIEYGWDGRGGSALLRSINGSAPAPAVDGVSAIEVTQTQRSPPTPVEGSERRLFASEIPVGAPVSEERVSGNDRVGAFFRLSLPATAASWRLTRARVLMRRESLLGASGVTATVFAADAGGRPTGSPLASRTVSLGTLTGGLVPEMIEFTLPAPGLGPSAGYCLVLSPSGTGATRAVVRTSGGPFNTHLLKSGSSGSTWDSPSDAADLRFEIFGVVSTLVETD
jgi:hypothetical protein